MDGSKTSGRIRNWVVDAPGFYTHQWTASDQHGGYVFFVAAVTSGALAGGVPSDQILGLATASLSFS